MLKGCRALDLTDEKGFLCGKILADLGVDVIKIEKPGGDPSRRKGPFGGGYGDPDRNLYWYAYNSNKRGITLNIETAQGKEILKKLVKSYDFIIESYDPGYLASLGLGYSDLSRINNEIIFTSITPFGQNGPYRDYQATDLVVMGMSCLMYLTGDYDRPPVNIGVPQACLHAGGDAAVGSLIAYYNKNITGKGQFVDISMQQSAAWFLAATIPFWELEGKVLKRAGTFRTGISGNNIQKQVWPCKDGYVFFVILGGRTGAKTSRQLIKWMDDEGASNEYLRGIDWDNLDMRAVSQDVIDKITKPIGDFLLTHTKSEILNEAITRRISICPLSSIQDLLNDPNLKARDFWTEIELPDPKRNIPYPKQFIKSTEVDVGTKCRPPLFGEHNETIYGELGISKIDLENMKKAGVV